MESSFLSRREWLSQAPLLVSAGLAKGHPFNAFSIAEKKHEARGCAGEFTYNIRDYGALGDGRSLDTKAVQSAINACFLDGGGIFLVPAGVFVIGTTELKSNLTLRIASGGILQGSGEGQHYHAVSEIPLSGDSTLNDGNWALLFAVNAHRICIEGPGTIDGQGREFHSPSHGILPPSGLDGDERPYQILLYQCEGVTIRDIDLVNCAYHCVRSIQSRRLTLEHIYINNRVNYNNDGFHFISCKYVTVSNCIVLCKDDACALFGSCQFVAVTNSIFSTRWSVFRFGGGFVRNITVSNCILFEVYGCPIKIQGSPGSSYENLAFSNIILDSVTGPIHIGAGPGAKWDGTPGAVAEPLSTVDPSTGALPGTTSPAVVRNLSFSNIHGTVTTSPPKLEDEIVYPGEEHSCITFNCIGDAVMENISLENVHLTFGGGGSAEEGARRDLPHFASEYFLLGPMPAFGVFARNVHGLSLSNIRLQTSAPDLRPALVIDGVRDAMIHNLSVQGNPASDTVVRIRNSQDVLITAARLLTPEATFLSVEGNLNRSIKVDGADLSMAVVAVRFESKAAEMATATRLL